MNDPEVTMSKAVPETKLVAHEKAVEAAGIAIALVMRVPAPLKSIANQVIRSASSVPANLAEGHGRTGRVRMNYWRIAYASAKEVDSHLTAACARWSGQSLSHQRRLGRIRSGTCDDLAAAQPQDVTLTSTSVT